MTGLNTSFRHHFFNTQGVLALLAAVLGGFLAWGGFAEIRDGHRLAVDGIEVTGRVTDREDTGATNSNFTRKVWYAYTPEGASGAIESGHRVSRDLFALARAGQARPVWYLATDPEVSEIERGALIAEGWRYVWFGALTLAAALGLAVSAWRKALVTRARYLNGVLRQARIVAHEPAAPDKNGKPRALALFRDDFGSEGRIGPRDLSFLPPVGNEITILVDRSGKHPPRWTAESWD
jgi:hypothetical protein